MIKLHGRSGIFVFENKAIYKKDIDCGKMMAFD